MPEIKIQNTVLGGLSDTKYLGIENSVYRAVGLDLHSEPGVQKVAQKLTKISASLVDGLCKRRVVASNGETYFFSADTGKIWRVKADFTVELAYTTTAAAGEVKCLGAAEYNGYIYWATQSRLHRILLTDALTTTWVPGAGLNWATFTRTDLVYHDMVVQNDILYIADGYALAQVNGNTFSATALDLPYPIHHRISALSKYLTGILTGTFVASTVVEAIVALWNTWSVSFSYQDELPEIGVNSFLKTDNYVIANIGKKGNFYAFNGSQMEQFKRIPGDWGGFFSSKAAIVHPDANVNLNGMPLFGLSNVSGDPTLEGIYSFGSYSREYPKIIDLTYPISTGSVAGVEIGAMALVGTDMLIAWKDGSTYGIDKVDTAAKFNGAYYETRIIKLDPDAEKEFLAEIYYRTLPTGTDITLYVSIDHGAYSQVSLTLDAATKKKYNKILIKATTVQFKVVTSSSVNNAPEIELAVFSYPE